MKILKIIFVFVILTCITITMTYANNGIVVSANNWEDWQNENYWEWHTRTTTNDKAFNGKHIKIGNDAIHFYGYWQNSYKDFLYKDYEYSGEKVFQFIIDESKANYHTLDGAGFLFNSKIEDNKLSGYIILFTEKELCLYKLENVDINKFETEANKKVESYGEIIERKAKINSKIHNLTITATPTNIRVVEGNSQLLDVKLDYSKHVGNSFGLISSYLQHSCAVLSEIEFTQLKIKVNDYDISILNSSTSGGTISGSSFVLKDENGNIVKSGITNSNGKWNITGLAEGIYTLQQVSVPSTYILNRNQYNFKITNDGRIVNPTTGKEMDLVVKNEKYRIDINCRTKDNKPVSGTKVGLYDSNGNKVGERTTDRNGNVSFTDITEGNYTYKLLETNSSNNSNSNNEYSCKVKDDGTIEFESNGGTIYTESKNGLDNENNEENSNNSNNNKEENNDNSGNNENNQSNVNNENKNNSKNDTKNDTKDESKVNKKDTTTSNKILPKAGLSSKILILSIFTILLTSIMYIVKIYKINKL